METKSYFNAPVVGKINLYQTTFLAKNQKNTREVTSIEKRLFGFLAGLISDVNDTTGHLIAFDGKQWGYNKNNKEYWDYLKKQSSEKNNESNSNPEVLKVAKMKKTKHNKKRNTAFLYEVLIKEMAKSAIEKDENKKNEIVAIAREFFSANKILGKELRIYKDLNETNSVDLYTAERLLAETKRAFDSVDRKEVFNEQTRLINKINKLVGKDAFNNFVPNYKDIATVGAWFQDNIPHAKSRLIVETKVIESPIFIESSNKLLL